MRRLLIGAFAGLALALTITATASATFNFFPCGGSCYLGPNARTTTGPYSNITRVYNATTNGDGVAHCAAGKGQANGLGDDIPGLYSVCGTAQIQTTQCSSPRFAYPTLISQSGSAHYFTGGYYFNNCSQ